MLPEYDFPMNLEGRYIMRFVFKLDMTKQVRVSLSHALDKKTKATE